MAGNHPRGSPPQNVQKWRYRATQLFQHVFSDDDLIDILVAQREAAKAGDLDAAKFIAEYSFVKAKNEDASRIQIGSEGDINIVIQSLPDDQLRALQSIDAAITSAESHALPDTGVR